MASADPASPGRDGRLAAPAGARSAGPALLAIGLIWLLAVLRWQLSDSVVPWDSKNQFFAFFRFLAESLHAGTSTFWNPYHYGGHPSIADPQSLVFSPPFLLWAWLDRTPSLRSFDLIVHAHLLVGGLAVAGLGARRGWPAAASVLASAVFMLGGSASARLNHTGIILCYGLFPLALLTLELALSRRSITMALACGLATSMIMLARNQVALMLCLMLAAFAFSEVVRSGRPWRYLKDRMPLLSIAALTVLVLTFVPVLLTLQLASLSNRPAVQLTDALPASLYPANLASLFSANVFGSHAAELAYWGPHYTNLPEVGATDDSFNYLFVGAAPSVLVLWLGIATGACWRRGCRTLALILLIGTLFSLGRYTPLFPIVFEHVPGFTFFRRPIDGTFVMLIAMALLSGQLLADYVRNGLSPSRPLPSALLAAGIIALIASVLHLSSRSNHELDALQALAGAALAAGAVVATMVALGRSGRRQLAAVMLGAATAVELVCWNAASRLNSEHRKHYEVLEAASADDAEALRILRRELAQRRLEGARPRVEIVGLAGPWQNLAMIHKLESTNGYNPLRIGIYDKFISPGESSWVASARRFPATFTGYDCALARALGLEYIVLDRPIEDLGQAQRRLRHDVLMAGPKVWIYRVPGAMPRVVFSSRVEVADVDATTVSGELRHPPAVDRVVIDDETPPPSGLVWMRAAAEGSRAVISSWRPGRIEIDVEAAQAGVLVLHDTYYPGWVAELNGERVPILRAEVLFRAVELPAGRHTVVFRFAPLSIENLAEAIALVAGRHRRPLTEDE